MPEIYTLRISDGRNVLAAIENFMRKRHIELAFPSYAYGSIKNFELLSLSGSMRLVRDFSGKGYELSAISGKVHITGRDFYSNITVILNRSYSTTLHGILKKAQAANSLEIGLKKINLGNIIEV